MLEESKKIISGEKVQRIIRSYHESYNSNFMVIILHATPLYYNFLMKNIKNFIKVVIKKAVSNWITTNGQVQESVKICDQYFESDNMKSALKSEHWWWAVIGVFCYHADGQDMMAYQTVLKLVSQYELISHKFWAAEVTARQRVGGEGEV